MSGLTADAALMHSNMRVGLEPEILAAETSWCVFDVAAPDHGLHVVLEEDGVGQVRKVAGGREVIDDGAIEALFANQLFEESVHAGRVEALDGDWREESADGVFGVEGGTGLVGDAVLETGTILCEYSWARAGPSGCEGFSMAT